MNQRAERNSPERVRPSARVPSIPPPRVDLQLPTSGEVPFDERYLGREPLARASMDDVLLCRDERIGRRVAMKVIDASRGSFPEFRARFLREARIQGQLEHPSVVPVYDMGVDPSGREYFTMKHVAGVTLGNVLGALMSGDPSAEEQFPQLRLLQIFRMLCEVIEYAHSKGVIHRDIKPSNIMIGDFGEVYLLDWGLAKIVDQEPASSRGKHVTASGQVMGTPGYMPPEQLIGARLVDQRGDIYSLGTILFEMLALEQLHVGESVNDIVRSTQCGADARASERAPHRAIAPELDAITVRATATKKEDRFTSVRELREALDAYLDGGRDLELRRALARRHEIAARDALAEVVKAVGDMEALRTTAVREAGKALALDPESAVAQRILATLLVEPPEQLPPQVEQSMAAEANREIRTVGVVGGIGFLSFTAAATFNLWAGIRSWFGFAAIFVPLLVASACAFHLKRTPTAKNVIVMMFFASLAVAATSGLFGPLILVPTLAAAIALVINFNYLRDLRSICLALAASAFIVPALLEWIGLFPHCYVFANGVITVLPVTENHPALPTRIGLLATNLGAIIVPALVAWRQSDILLDLERTMHLTAWHLRRLVPQEDSPLPPES